MNKLIQFMAFATLAVFSLSLTSCGDDDDNDNGGGGTSPKPDYSETIVSTGSASSVSSTTATVFGKWIADVSLLKDAKFGFVYSSKVNTPTMNNGTKAECNEIDGNVFSVELSNLDPSTIFYYRAYAKINGTVQYGNAMSFTTKEINIPQSGAVDLGLSVLWAACNVGASKPEDNGDYYAWGETAVKDNNSWSTYKWCNGSYTTLTKYNTNGSNGTIDNKTILDPEDDVAHVKWGGKWRMPTRDEIRELYENCSWTRIEHNGVEGCRISSKTNGNSIFLPAAGMRHSSLLFDNGYEFYWSSSLVTPGSTYAYGFSSSSGSNGWDISYRSEGRSVRPVCPK